jgi:hypothetical protein
LNILNKHLYRTSAEADEDKPVITIPFSTIRDVINAHERQRSYLDITHDIKKRHLEEEDEKNNDEVAGEIMRLKKRRVKDF